MPDRKTHTHTDRQTEKETSFAFLEAPFGAKNVHLFKFNR